jgi:Na+/H+ antiporter NhaD/arsenite permease-like protein
VFLVFVTLLTDLAATILLLVLVFFSQSNKKMLNILQSRNEREAIYNILVFTLFVVIMTVIMKFLWNDTLVKHITVLRPVDSLLQTFLLALGIALFKL